MTGGLSCGKSSVCRLLSELGAYVISADTIVHQLLSSDANLGQEVVKLLGSEILVGSYIDRSRIAEIVFQEPDLLVDLENLLHPAVYREIEKIYQEQQNSPHPPPLFIAEIPLLFESGGEKDYDFTVTVAADPVLCFQRFSKKTGLSKKEFERRTSRQLPLLEKAKRADYVIMNSDTLSNLAPVIKELYEELISAFVHK